MTYLALIIALVALAISVMNLRAKNKIIDSVSKLAVKLLNAGERLCTIEGELERLPFEELEENMNRQLALEKEWTSGMENILAYTADSVPKLNREGIRHG